jgi:hypothetical protein
LELLSQELLGAVDHLWLSKIVLQLLQERLSAIEAKADLCFVRLCCQSSVLTFWMTAKWSAIQNPSMLER